MFTVYNLFIAFIHPQSFTQTLGYSNSHPEVTQINKRFISDIQEDFMIKTKEMAEERLVYKNKN